MSLGKCRDDGDSTKGDLAEVFGCADRTLQRMVERLDIPPPVLLAGRTVWIVVKIRAWGVQAAEREEAQALKAAGFDTLCDNLMCYVTAVRRRGMGKNMATIFQNLIGRTKNVTGKMENAVDAKGKATNSTPTGGRSAKG